MGERPISKAPPVEKCEMCGQYREVHQRTDREGNPEVLCANCYRRKYPPRRSKGVCKLCFQYETIVGRGLCRKCYMSARNEGELENFPKKPSHYRLMVQQRVNDELP